VSAAAAAAVTRRRSRLCAARPPLSVLRSRRRRLLTVQCALSPGTAAPLPCVTRRRGHAARPQRRQCLSQLATLAPPPRAPRAGAGARQLWTARIAPQPLLCAAIAGGGAASEESTAEREDGPLPLPPGSSRPGARPGRVLRAPRAGACGHGVAEVRERHAAGRADGVRAGRPRPPPADAAAAAAALSPLSPYLALTWALHPSLTHPFPLNRRRTPPKKRNKNR